MNQNDTKDKPEPDMKITTLPPRRRIIRLRKNINGELIACLIGYRGKVSLKVYLDGRYSHVIIIKNNTKKCKIDRIEGASNVRVRLFRGKHFVAASKTFRLDSGPINKKYGISETINGSLTSTNPWQLYKFTITEAVEVTVSASYDCDLYANWDTTSQWEFRSESYTGNETLQIPKPDAARTLYVLVYRYSGSGQYNLMVSPVDTNISWSETATKKALLSGISDYLNISDLSYCDEDVVDWYNYLTAQGYECKVLGDSHPGNFPRYDGLATKDNVRQGVKKLAETAKDGDTIAFITSGHGHGDSKGKSYLCTYGGQSYHDTELHDDISVFGGNKIVIIDHCFSGGFADNLSALPNVFFGATCTESGYGYDVSTYQNGAFTYAWQETLLTNPPDTMVNLFKKVEEIYQGSDAVADQPMYICTNDEICF